MIGNPDPNPNRFGPSQPTVNFVDGNSYGIPYTLLWGVVEGRDGEVGLGKVMKAWGSDDKKVVGKIFQLPFNGGRSEEQARDPDLPRRWQSNSSLGQGVGEPLFKKFHPPSWKVSLRSGSFTQ